MLTFALKSVFMSFGLVLAALQRQMMQSNRPKQNPHYKTLGQQQHKILQRQLIGGKRMKQSQKVICLAMVCALMLTVLAGCGGSAPASSAAPAAPAAPASSAAPAAPAAPAPAPVKLEEFITIGTSSSGGTFNTLGVAIAQTLSAKIKETSFSAEVTGGSGENCARIGNGELQMAFAAASAAFEAANGVGAFDGKKVDNIRAIVNMYPAVMQISALEKSGIKEVGDIVGKKINIGQAGSGSESQSIAMLESFGIGLDTFDPQRLSHANAADAMVDEKLDAYINLGAMGQSHQMKAMTSGKAVMVDFTPKELVDKLIEKYPYYYHFTIPAGTYPNQKTDNLTFATGTLLITSAEVSEELVYQSVKNLFESVPELAKTVAIASNIKHESALNVAGIELHPGAIRYYKEVGIIK
jgi:TRAP transporter TAXI family solute receptor